MEKSFESEYWKSIPSIIEKIIEPLNADVFVQVWDETGFQTNNGWISSKVAGKEGIPGPIPSTEKVTNKFLNDYFGNSCSSFITLSKSVANEIKLNFSKPILKGFHPINEFLPVPISKVEARKNLNLYSNASYILFFGIFLFSGLNRD